MAKIPDASSLGGARATSRFQAQSYRPIIADTGGEGLAKAGAEVSRAAGAIFGDLAAEKQTNDLRKAQVDFSQRKLQILEGDGDQDPGYRGMLGQNALDNFADYKDRIEAARKETLGTLQGPVGATFDIWSQSEANGTVGVMLGHLNDQRVVVADQSSLGFIEQMKQEIAANPNDPTNVKGKRMEIMRATLEMADRKGIKDADARTALVRANWTEAHKASIERLLAADDVDAAKAYLDQYRGDIDQLSIGAIESRVNGSEILQTAQTAADQAVMQFDKVEDALAWARKEHSGKAEKDVTAEIKNRFAEAESSRLLNNRALRASAQQKALDNKPLTVDERDAVNDVFGLPDRLERIRENAAAGLPQVSDEQTRQDLLKMYRDDKEAFMQADFYGEEFGGKLNKEHLTKFENLQLGLDKEAVKTNAAAGKAAAKERKLSTAMKISKPFLRDAGFRVGGPNDNTGPFQLKLADAIDALPDDVELTEKQLQEITLGLLLYGEERVGGWYDKDVRAFETGSKFSIEDFMSDNKAAIATLSERSGIATDRISIIVDGLIRAGRPIMVDTIKETDAALKELGK